MPVGSTQRPVGQHAAVPDLDLRGCTDPYSGTDQTDSDAIRPSFRSDQTVSLTFLSVAAIRAVIPRATGPESPRRASNVASPKMVELRTEKVICTTEFQIESFDDRAVISYKAINLGCRKVRSLTRIRQRRMRFPFFLDKLIAVPVMTEKRLGISRRHRGRRTAPPSGSSPPADDSSGNVTVQWTVVDFL